MPWLNRMASTVHRLDVARSALRRSSWGQRSGSTVRANGNFGEDDAVDHHFVRPCPPLGVYDRASDDVLLTTETP
jgi:hypothetical protein